MSSTTPLPVKQSFGIAQQDTLPAGPDMTVELSVAGPLDGWPDEQPIVWLDLPVQGAATVVQVIDSVQRPSRHLTGRLTMVPPHQPIEPRAHLTLASMGVPDLVTTEPVPGVTVGAQVCGTYPYAFTDGGEHIVGDATFSVRPGAVDPADDTRR